MSAKLLLEERHTLGENAFAELIVWQVPSSVPGSAHPLKYRLALVVEGHCMLRYDNKAGKGDHRHVGAAEIPYAFTTPAQLIEDFWNDVDHWNP